MAKIHYHVSPQLTVEFDASNDSEIFRTLGHYGEILGINICGVCYSTKFPLRYALRTVNDNEFPELQCLNPDCQARLAFGQKKQDKTLYPRRKFHKEHHKVKAGEAEVGQRMPNGGWEKWTRKTDEEAEED